MRKDKRFSVHYCLLTVVLAFGLQFSSVISSRAATAEEKAKPVAQNQAVQSFDAAVKAEKGAVPIRPEQLSGGSAAARAPYAEVKVKKATGVNAYTVAEIFAKSKELNGKTVRVRGKLVRYNPAIMGKNWIHIQDGTGEPLHNTHDLVATSSDTATVGEVITVEGKLAADKDFGAGYVYAAIIEGAKVIK